MGENGSNWPRLLSLAVHEFRTPVTVVSGYVRMLLRERAGPLAENQRKLLEETEKSCGRLSTLIGEMSELGQLYDGRQSLASGSTTLPDILGGFPASEADQAPVVVEPVTEGPLTIAGDADRLRRTVQAIAHALRREIIDSTALVISASVRQAGTGRVAWIALGTPDVVAELKGASADALGPFDDLRGGCGLALPLARRVVELHGGRLMALRGDRQKAGGVIELPLAS